MSTNSSSSSHPATPIYSEDYQKGFNAGVASAKRRIEYLDYLCDYWYFRANNPGVKTADEKLIDAIIAQQDVSLAREQRRKQWVELDAVEEQMFNKARRLIAETDLNDVQIAIEVGVFAATVTTLRKEMAA